MSGLLGGNLLGGGAGAGGGVADPVVVRRNENPPDGSWYNYPDAREEPGSDFGPLAALEYAVSDGTIERLSFSTWQIHCRWSPDEGETWNYGSLEIRGGGLILTADPPTGITLRTTGSGEQSNLSLNEGEGIVLSSPLGVRLGAATALPATYAGRLVYLAQTSPYLFYGVSYIPRDNGGNAVKFLPFAHLISGPTDERPSGLQAGLAGFQYFDTTLNRPLFWNGAAWVPALLGSTDGSNTLGSPFRVSGQAGAAQIVVGNSGTPIIVGADPAAVGDTNVGLVLTAKGTGAISAHVPDSAATGGNARGASATDWQRVRGTAAQVASGTQATVGGGANNTASGNQSTVAGGNTNTASATNAAVGGGTSNQASGSNSWIPGGANASTRSVSGKGAFASGQFSTAGDAQAGEGVVRRQSTSATAVRLTSDAANPGTSNTLNLPTNGTFLIRLMVVARQTGGTAGAAGDSAGWTLEVLIKRGATAAATVVVGGGGTGLAPTFNDTAAAAWRIDVAADTTNGGLAISGIGEANKNINWVARAISVEVVG